MAGLMKYGVSDFRDILERASARETAIRVAAGVVCKLLLKAFGISIMSYTVQIGNILANMPPSIRESDVRFNTEVSYVRCPNANASRRMVKLIKKAGQKGDTLGGKIAVVVNNVPVGLGSHTQWDLKLDGSLAKSLISIQAIKAVEFGAGTKLASLFGSFSQD